MQTLDIISVNLWQMLASLANLVLLFLIVKKFLYQPVKKMLETRQNAIDADYAAAASAKEQAQAEQKAYEAKRADAKAEADRVIRAAADIATEREQEIVAAAKTKADGIVRQAQEEAALERRKAEEGIRKEIVEVSSALAEKLLEREVSADDHRRLIDTFIDEIGDGYDAD